ncbi:hypothetical protein EDD85DRAFT_870557 [Armillaria nabsnona]|nr:hypothetical protein EDD85DRAFT_870557 [Armillaria nabsnona]
MAVGTVSSPLCLIVSHTLWYVELSDSLIPTLCYLCSMYAVDNLRSSSIPCDGPIPELRECAASQKACDKSVPWIRCCYHFWATFIVGLGQLYGVGTVSRFEHVFRW